MATNFEAQRRKLEREIERLQKKKELMMVKERQPVIQKIVSDMRGYGISLEEVEQAYSKGSKGKAARKASTKATGAARKKSEVPIKYRDDKGNTWTGRGRAPLWVVDAEKAGRSRTEFLVDSDKPKAAPAQTGKSGDDAPVSNLQTSD